MNILEFIRVYSLWPTHACIIKLFLTGETFTHRAIRIKVFDWDFDSVIEYYRVNVEKLRARFLEFHFSKIMLTQ